MGSSICSDQGTNVLTKQFLPCFDKSIHPIRSSSALFFWTVGHFFSFLQGGMKMQTCFLPDWSSDPFLYQLMPAQSENRKSETEGMEVSHFITSMDVHQLKMSTTLKSHSSKEVEDKLIGVTGLALTHLSSELYNFLSSKPFWSEISFLSSKVSDKFTMTRDKWAEMKSHSKELSDPPFRQQHSCESPDV